MAVRVNHIQHPKTKRKSGAQLLWDGNYHYCLFDDGTKIPVCQMRGSKSLIDMETIIGAFIAALFMGAIGAMLLL